jgi:hypothetical protein
VAGRAGGADSRPARPLIHLTWVFHAVTHWEYGTQSGLPLSQVAIGVFHSLIVLK